MEGKVIEEGKMNQSTVYLILSTFMFIFAHKCRKIFLWKRRCIKIGLGLYWLTNTYLAEQLGVSKMTISRWCTNATQPSAPQLIEISRVLQCDLKDLYEKVE